MASAKAAKIGIATIRRIEGQDLARQTALSVATIRRAEISDDETSMTAANNLAVRDALESAGIEFIEAKWSWLKAWAMKIARHRGMKKAIVALARRLMSLAGRWMR